jgi:hypothetical protein
MLITVPSIGVPTYFSWGDNIFWNMIDVFVINLDPATRSPCYTPEQPRVGHSLFDGDQMSK